MSEQLKDFNPEEFSVSGDNPDVSDQQKSDYSTGNYVDGLTGFHPIISTDNATTTQRDAATPYPKPLIIIPFPGQFSGPIFETQELPKVVPIREGEFEIDETHQFDVCELEQLEENLRRMGKNRHSFKQDISQVSTGARQIASIVVQQGIYPAAETISDNVTRIKSQASSKVKSVVGQRAQRKTIEEENEELKDQLAAIQAKYSKLKSLQQVRSAAGETQELEINKIREYEEQQAQINERYKKLAELDEKIAAKKLDLQLWSAVKDSQKLDLTDFQMPPDAAPEDTEYSNDAREIYELFQSMYVPKDTRGLISKLITGRARPKK